MTRVLFLHGHHRHAVRTAFGWQIDINKFRELLAQNRHKHFVHGYAKHRRFIRWTAGIGTVINGILTVGYTLHGEYGETLYFVVITRVVTKGAFIGIIVW